MHGDAATIGGITSGAVGIDHDCSRSYGEGGAGRCGVDRGGTAARQHDEERRGEQAGKHERKAAQARMKGLQMRRFSSAGLQWFRLSRRSPGLIAWIQGVDLWPG